MIYCKSEECSKLLNSRNACGYCAKHRHLSKQYKESAKRNRDKLYLSTKKYKLTRYWPGLTSHQAFAKYNELFDLQQGKCAICPKHQSECDRSLCVDHCHITGVVRGLLCDACNKALGLFKDSPELIDKAAIYLRRSKLSLVKNGN